MGLWHVWQEVKYVEGFVEKLEGKRPLGKPGYRWEDNNNKNNNVKCILKKKAGRAGTGLICLRTGIRGGDLLNLVMKL